MRASSVENAASLEHASHTCGASKNQGPVFLEKETALGTPHSTNRATGMFIFSLLTSFTFFWYHIQFTSHIVYIYKFIYTNNNLLYTAGVSRIFALVCRYARQWQVGPCSYKLIQVQRGLYCFVTCGNTKQSALYGAPAVSTFLSGI